MPQKSRTGPDSALQSAPSRPSVRLSGFSSGFNRAGGCHEAARPPLPRGETAAAAPTSGCSAVTVAMPKSRSRSASASRSSGAAAMAAPLRRGRPAGAGSGRRRRHRPFRRAAPRRAAASAGPNGRRERGAGAALRERCGAHTALLGGIFVTRESTGRAAARRQCGLAGGAGSRAARGCPGAHLPGAERGDWVRTGAAAPPSVKTRQGRAAL